MNNSNAFSHPLDRPGRAAPTKGAPSPARRSFLRFGLLAATLAAALVPGLAHAGQLGFKAEGFGNQSVGVWGEASGDSSAGIHAHATGPNATGAFAYGSKFGVKGYADADSVPGSIGVLGYGETGVDAYGRKTGIHITTGATGTALVGEGGSFGLFGTANFSKGSFGAGIQGQADIGVVARGNTLGVDAYANGIAVAGNSVNDVGGLFIGAKAPIRLMPANTAGAPQAASGIHHMGEMYIDSKGALYLCTGDGTPGLWKKVVLQ